MEGSRSKLGGNWKQRSLSLSSSSSSSQRGRPTWIISLLVCCVSLFLVVAYLHPPTGLAACYNIFSSSSSSNACTFVVYQLGRYPSSLFPAAAGRQVTDDEFASQLVVHEILNTPHIQPTNPKIAFLFLTPANLPFENLWNNFFHGYDGRFSIYVYASKETSRISQHFIGRDINHKDGEKQLSVVDAEKRLLTYSLLDPDNQHFVLLSESCVPLHSFEYIYHYLVFTNVSFIDCFVDPGRHGNGRYSKEMMPEIEKKDFRKGSQWFSMKRQHALILIADNLYYTKFKRYCKPNMDGRHCYAHEHYLPTFFQITDPKGIANRSVTYVDWSEGKWHPKTYRATDVTHELLKNLSRQVSRRPCLWNGMRRPCYLFARKFYPNTLDKLTFIFSNYSSI